MSVTTRGRSARHVRLPGGRQLLTFTSLSSAGLGEAVLPTLSLIALVRMTGAQTSGQVIFTQSVAGLWFLVSNPGLEDATQRFVPLEQRRSGGGSALFLLLLRWSTGIGLAATAVALVAILAARLLGLVSGGLALMLALAVVGRGAIVPYATAGAGLALANRLRTFGMLRVLAAFLSFGLSLVGLWVGGPLLYLAGQAVGALAMAAVICLTATRATVSALGPVTGNARLPAGLIPFTFQTSVGTTVAGVSDTGILTIAGFIGGPSLVTILKIAMAPGRFYANLTIPVTTMLYPRITQAVAQGAGPAFIKRIVRRTSLLLSVSGAVTALVAFPLIGTVIAMAYGAEYADAGAVAMLLLGAACVKGVACWSNTLALGVGKPGWRLTYLTAEAALLVAALLLAHWSASGSASVTMATALHFASGTLVLAALGSGFWLTMLGPVTAPRPEAPAPAERPARPLQRV
ncbi:lipopolysaccharide biosynthesis protein [Microtetraspora fusca]|uniref:Lipopolysaccharide biosynthesis protein n=1 Tax=Microtetraspora fusca TaxID=1997 RepID=A0ABW6V8X6_MICFU